MGRSPVCAPDCGWAMLIDAAHFSADNHDAERRGRD